MSKFSSDARQRRSKKYRETHEALRKELEAKGVLKPETVPDKRNSRIRRSEQYRQTGDLG